MNNIQKEKEEHSLQWSVHFDIDRSLHQTRRKTPRAPAIHNGYIAIITQKKIILLNSNLKSNYET